MCHGTAVEEPHEGLLQPRTVEESHEDMEVPVPAEPECKPEVGMRARPASPPPEAGAPRGPVRRMHTWLPVSHAAPMPRRYCLPRGPPMDQLRCHHWRSGCCSRLYVHSATASMLQSTNMASGLLWCFTEDFKGGKDTCYNVWFGDSDTKKETGGQIRGGRAEETTTIIKRKTP